MSYPATAVWGYDEKFKEACRRELSFDARPNLYRGESHTLKRQIIL